MSRWTFGRQATRPLRRTLRRSSTCGVPDKCGVQSAERGVSVAAAGTGNDCGVPNHGGMRSAECGISMGAAGAGADGGRLQIGEFGVVSGYWFVLVFIVFNFFN